MKNEQSPLAGVVYAVLAAFCNATIGIFTNIGIGASLRPETIAFYRCVVAFSAVTLFLAVKGQSPLGVTAIRSSLPKVMLCAFFGIFVLYYFETISYRFTSVANVTFLLQSTSSLVTFVLAGLLLKEKTSPWKLAGLGIVLLGAFFMVFGGGLYRPNLKGDFLALVAGTGYALFLVLTRRFKLGTGMQTLWWFFAVGMVYLAVPLLNGGSFVIGLRDVPVLLLLGIVPTLGGFFFTTKALDLLEANRVQLFEMSEPVFASAMAFVILSQAVSPAQAFGGCVIILGLFLAEKRMNVREVST